MRHRQKPTSHVVETSAGFWREKRGEISRRQGGRERGERWREIDEGEIKSGRERVWRRVLKRIEGCQKEEETRLEGELTYSHQKQSLYNHK